MEGAGRIGDGELGTRIGDLNAGPELDALARSLDAAADRLRVARECGDPGRADAPRPDRGRLA